jgi:hypothetical protein
MTRRIMGLITGGIWAKGVFLVTKKGRWLIWFGDDTALASYRKVQMSNGQSRAWFGVLRTGGRKTTFGATHSGVIMHIGGSWSIWCPKHHFGDQQLATLLLLCEGWAGGGWGRASLIITAEQLEPFILGGSHLVLWAQTLCFPWFWKAFPETNSGYNNYAGW